MDNAGWNYAGKAKEMKSLIGDKYKYSVDSFRGSKEAMVIILETILNYVKACDAKAFKMKLSIVELIE